MKSLEASIDEYNGRIDAEANLRRIVGAAASFARGDRLDDIDELKLGVEDFPAIAERVKTRLRRFFDRALARERIDALVELSYRLGFLPFSRGPFSPYRRKMDEWHREGEFARKIAVVNVLAGGDKWISDARFLRYSIHYLGRKDLLSPLEHLADLSTYYGKPKDVFSSGAARTSHYVGRLKLEFNRRLQRRYLMHARIGLGSGGAECLRKAYSITGIPPSDRTLKRGIRVVLGEGRKINFKSNLLGGLEDYAQVIERSKATILSKFVPDRSRDAILYHLFIKGEFEIVDELRQKYGIEIPAKVVERSCAYYERHDRIAYARTIRRFKSKEPSSV